jgi:hypothetical protein
MPVRGFFMGKQAAAVHQGDGQRHYGTELEMRSHAESRIALAAKDRR